MDSEDVSVRLLGPVTVEVDGRSVGGFRSNKTLAMLAFLVVEQRAVARSYLAELLWPEATPAEGRGHLRRALHDLSQKMPGALLIDYHTLQFNPNLLGRTDLAQFEALWPSGDLTSLELAAALCRGQFMEGITLDDCPAFDTWLMAERQTWLGKAVGVLEALRQRHVATLRFDLALNVAWRLLQLDPWREQSYEQVMILLARTGDLVQSLKLYKRYRRVLVGEMALEPSPVIESLCERMLQARARRPGNIPNGLSAFVGRKRELAALTQALVEPGCRLITLTGPGGIGKTRLALEAAARANGPTHTLFLDGAFVARLDPVNDIAGLLGTMAQALGLTTGTTLSVTPDMLLRRVQNREMLLVLDGFDNLLGQRELLLALLEAAPELRLLVTCQEPLQLPGERVHVLKGLAITAEEGHATPEALRFFLACLKTHGRGVLTGDEMIHAMRICQLVGGLPLAIELAAAWLSTGGLRRLAVTLEHDLDVLATGDAPNLRHASLRAALDTTWDRLRPQEREALRLLAVFPGPFTAEAARRIVQVAPWQLTALVHRSLVDLTLVGENGRGARYGLHPLIRQYAAEKLADNVDLCARAQAAYDAYSREHAASLDALFPGGGAFIGPSDNLPARPLLIEHFLMA
jgi:predicted ATPase/DNA-binding SARP family transcriptional activator